MIPALPPATVRERIMAHLVQRFKNCVAGQDGRFITWNEVLDVDPGSQANILETTLIVTDDRETKKAEQGFNRCTLEVTTEFFVRLAIGDNPRKAAQLVLGEVQTVMRSDIHCGNLSLNIVERGNELNVDGKSDTTVSGIVYWEVQYRHKSGDPRKLMGE